MRRASLLGLSAIPLAGAAVWFFLTGGPRAGELTSTRPRSEAAEVVGGVPALPGRPPSRAESVPDAPTSDREPVAASGGVAELELAELDFPCPRESGDATLLVEVRDRAGGEALAGRIELFRLDVPEDECWTAGDESLGGFDVPAVGLEIPRLAPGRYRAALLSQRLHAPDPTAFTLLAGARDALVLFAEPPRELIQHALLFTESGERLVRAERHSSSSSSDTQRVVAVEWARRRVFKHRRAIGVGGGGAGGRYGGSTRWFEVEAGPHGFELGSFPEDSRTEHHQRGVELRAPGRAPCSFVLEGDQLEDGVPIGVSIDPEPALAAVRLPDGRDGRAIRESVHVYARSLRAAPDDLDAWRRVEIRTVVTLEGYERAVSVHRLADGDFPLLFPRPRVEEP